MKKKIYIAGCGGMLGDAFYHQFKDDYVLKCSDKSLNNKDTWLSYLDFRQKDMYMSRVSAFYPDYLFHLGALADINECENNPDEAYKANTLAVEDAVEIANRFNIPLLYISTAGMFDGEKDLYDDWDTPNPLNVYARSKYLGERIVVENAKQYLVCRAGWMVGGGPAKDKKFVHKIMTQLKEGKEELVVVDNESGNMTYTHDFAKNVRLLIETNHFGVYNMVCKGTTTRLEITKEILRILRLEDKIRITTVTSDYFKHTKRPCCENLINKKLDLRGLNVMRDWKEALREYIETDYKDYLK